MLWIITEEIHLEKYIVSFDNNNNNGKCYDG